VLIPITQVFIFLHRSFIRGLTEGATPELPPEGRPSALVEERHYCVIVRTIMLIAVTRRPNSKSGSSHRS
jgi:hypothetical protein